MATNENLIPIPGRLHSVATEGHVAGADEIYDDTLQKDQATINSDVNEALEDVVLIDDSDPSSAVVPDFDPASQSLHIIPQVLSEQQKAQARTNIDLNDLVKYSEQTLTTAQKDQVAQNLNNKNATNGMARIELKATDDFKAVVEAQTGGNTIFVIKYDYTLTGNVTVPANCVLGFNGGSISGNGINKNTITGNNTQIIAPKTSIFTGIIIAGIWNVPYITSDWFGDATTRDNVIKSIFNLASDTIHNEIIIEEGDYWASKKEDEVYVLLAKSNTRYVIKGNIRTRTSSQDRVRTIYIYEAENVTIEGGGCIYGDKLTHIYYDGNSYPDGYIPGFIYSYGYNPTVTPSNPEGYSSHEQCHGVAVIRCSNILIKDLSIYDCVGDCLDINNSKYVTVRNVHLENGRRNGCSLSGSNILFENITIKNIKGTAPESGIDIEIASDETVVMSENIIFRNMSIEGVSCGIIATGQYDNYGKILIQNVHVKDASRGLSVHNYANKVLVENSSFNVTIRGSKVYPERFLQGLLLSQVHLRDCYITINVPYIKPGFDPSDESKVIHFEDYLTYDISETEETEEEIRELYHAIEIETKDTTIDSCVIRSNVGSIQGNDRLYISNNFIKGGNIDCGSHEGIFIVGNKLDLPNSKVKGSRMFITGNDFTSCSLIEGTNVSVVGNYLRIENTIDTVLFRLSSHSRVIGNRISIASGLEINSICNVTTGIIAGNMINGLDVSIPVLPTGNNGWAYDNYSENVLLQETYNKQKRTGTTSNRPTAPQAGFQFFDTTLGKPIYWNGTAWVDATGATV